MLPDRVLNPGPLTYESGALPIAQRGPAMELDSRIIYIGVGRFRILGGPRFRILGGQGGGQIPSRHMTS